MEAMRESWTDDRLDYLNHRVDDGFTRLDERFGLFEKQILERFDQAETRTKERFDEVDRRLDLADSRFEQINERMLELHRLIIQGGIAMLVALLTLLATQL
jgi:chromosome segregation ATPase